MEGMQETPAKKLMVSQEFINRYAHLAEGLYVKVYLYLLSCLENPDSDFELEGMADRLGITEREAETAFRFWEMEKVVRIAWEGDSGVSEIKLLRNFSIKEAPVANRFVTAEEGYPVNYGMCRVDIFLRSEGKPAEREPEGEGVRILDMPEKLPRYPVDELNRFFEDTDAALLAREVSLLLQHQLQIQEMRLIYCFSVELGYPKDVILYIFRDCYEKKKKAAEYIYKVGLSMYGKKPKTASDADEYSKFCHTGLAVAMNAFGLRRLPGKAELKYINRWNGLGLGKELIEEACSRTLLRLGKPDFVYADKVIENWASKNVRTIADVQRLDLEHQERKNAGRKKQDAPKPESVEVRDGGYGKLDGSELEKILLGIRDGNADRRAEA